MKTTKIETVKLPAFDGEVRPDQMELANLMFSLAHEKHISKTSACYKVSTKAFVKFKDALKLYEMWFKQQSDAVRRQILEDLLMSDDDEQIGTAREVKEGTQVLSASGEWDEDQTFQGTPRIDY